MAGISLIKYGATVPVVLQIADGATDQYPQANIYDNDGNLLATENMAHEASGLYVASYTMPNEIFIKVVFIVYSDAGHTTESTIYLRDVDVFIRDNISADWTNGGRLDALIDAIKAKTDDLPADPADQSTLEAAITTAEGNVRGGADTLDTLSDQLDTAQADLNNPNQYKATGFATQNPPSQVLDDYKADVTGFSDILDDLQDVALGKWVVDPTAKTMTLYRQDGTVLKAFDLTSTVGDVPAFIERIP